MRQTKHTGRLAFTAIVLLGLMSTACMAQLPETDIWLFQLSKKDSVWSYQKGLNITNRKGYDNQPCFMPGDRSLLYVSICEDGQADVYQYEIKTHHATRLTNTPESEYSPAITPDHAGLSCVVVEKDSAQRIWLYDLQGRFKKIVHEGTDSVGYYTWLNHDSLLYYKLTAPHSLRALDLRTGRDVKICDQPGRAFRPVAGSHRFMYEVKKDSTGMYYRLYDPTLRKSSDYAMSPSPGEDFVWSTVFGLVRSENGTLLVYRPKTGTWATLFDFTKSGITKITRFMFDAQHKQLVIVSNL